MIREPTQRSLVFHKEDENKRITKRKYSQVESVLRYGVFCFFLLKTIYNPFFSS